MQLKEAPNSKLQIPENLQAPITNIAAVLSWRLRIGISLGLGVWGLVLS
jgi:hypothetical protein